jgi:hypothetical protein
MAGTPHQPKLQSLKSFPTRSIHLTVISKSLQTQMVSFLSFLTLSLAGMAVASVVGDVDRRELGVKSNLEIRAVDDCSDPTQSSYISDS